MSLFCYFKHCIAFHRYEPLKASKATDVISYPAASSKRQRQRRGSQKRHDVIVTPLHCDDIDLASEKYDDVAFEQEHVVVTNGQDNDVMTPLHDDALDLTLANDENGVMTWRRDHSLAASKSVDAFLHSATSRHCITPHRSSVSRSSPVSPGVSATCTFDYHSVTKSPDETRPENGHPSLFLGFASCYQYDATRYIVERHDACCDDDIIFPLDLSMRVTRQGVTCQGVTPTACNNFDSARSNDNFILEKINGWDDVTGKDDANDGDGVTMNGVMDDSAMYADDDVIYIDDLDRQLDSDKVTN